jgi:hypothetical protein
VAISDDGALAASIARVAATFNGMTARVDETGCGRCFTEAELRLLRSPGTPLPAELVLQAAHKEPFHWDDQPAIIRRVLPQLVVMLAEGTYEPDLIARNLAAAGWSRWPSEQARSVAGFLDAWWTQTLREESPPTPAREVFESCAIASASVTAWLARWDTEMEMGSIASQHLNESLSWWRDDLTSDTSPSWWWGSKAEEQAAWQELKIWLAGHADQS